MILGGVNYICINQFITFFPKLDHFNNIPKFGVNLA